jgi:uncharacterized membrane protein YedE/YeeE
MKYLLPCDHCGEKSVIDASQAGRQIICPCGASLEVPSFRAVRKLEQYSEQQTAPRRAWNPVRGTMFALGVILVLLGLLAAAAGGIGWSRIDTATPPEEDLDELLASLDGMGPSAAWDIWQGMRDRGLGPYRPPAHVEARQWAAYYRGVMLGGLGVVAVGAVVTACPLLFTRKRRR